MTMTLRKWWRAWASQNVIGTALIVLALLSGGTTYLQAERTSRLAECTAGYQAGFSQALSLRSASQEEFNAALKDLIATVAVATPATRDSVPTALQRFLAAANNRDTQLREHPYPDPVACR